MNQMLSSSSQSLNMAKIDVFLPIVPLVFCLLLALFLRFFSLSLFPMSLSAPSLLFLPFSLLRLSYASVLQGATFFLAILLKNFHKSPPFLSNSTSALKPHGNSAVTPSVVVSSKALRLPSCSPYTFPQQVSQKFAPQLWSQVYVDGAAQIVQWGCGVAVEEEVWVGVEEVEAGWDGGAVMGLMS